MPTTLPDTIEISRLTSGTVAGNGTFDVLMRSIKEHLEQEFKNNRIRGPEYSTVYLGAVQSVLQASMSFLLSQEKAALENKLIEAQIEQAKAQTVQVEAQTLLIEQQKANLVAEALNIPKQGLLIDAQKDVQVASKLQTEAQTLLVSQQRTNLVAEAANIPKQGLVLDVQKLQIESQTQLVGQQRTNLIAEALNIPKQGLLIDAQKDVQVQQKLNLVTEELLTGARIANTAQQTTNLAAEALNIPKQGQLIDAQRAQTIQTTDNLLQTKAQITAQTALIGQQLTNAITEQTVLVAQECKLRAEFDGIEANSLKTAQETLLLTQKVVTEQAQTQATGVSVDSVIGKQKALYTAQANGFTRDAEQKAAKILADAWSVQKSTDPDGTPANSTNQLNDAAIGRAINKLLTGVGA